MPRWKYRFTTIAVLTVVGAALSFVGLRSETRVRSSAFGMQAVVSSQDAGAETFMPASVRRDSLALTVLNDGERYVLHWLVPPALSCMSFIIERRLSETYSFTSDTRWIEIGMEPGMCNLFEAVPYSFPDRSTTTGMKGIMQYRLSVRTEGGGELVSYSEVITLSVPDQLEIRDMYPQPASMQVQMSFLTSDADPVTVRIFDMTGTELRRTAFSVPRPGVQHHILDVSSLPAGIYVCASESRQSIAVRTFRVVR